MKGLLRKDEILISKHLDKDIPILIVDFDNFNLEDPNDKIKALNILKNFNNISHIYSTSKNNSCINELYSSKKLNDWSFNEGKLFLEDLKNSGIKNMIQLCGIYRELCIVEVASLIKKSILNIEPIIIDNDNYSISAKYSVASGDTLENRLAEHNLFAKYINKS